MRTHSLTAITSLFFFLIVSTSVCAIPQNNTDPFIPGARVVFVDRAEGIPGHPEVGNNSVSHRYPGGSEATILEKGTDSHKHWIKVEAGSENHWIITKYVANVFSSPTPPLESTTTYTFGCWNLEHFNNSAKRGFPEYLHAGPKYDPRTDNDLMLIADVITNRIGAELLVLNEINGKTEMVDEDTVASSDELDALLEKLPDTWSYT
ncbi:MAG: hypothetical protein ABIK28_15070, partial [Planctomycetota bacterium]